MTIVGAALCATTACGGGDLTSREHDSLAGATASRVIGLGDDAAEGGEDESVVAHDDAGSWGETWDGGAIAHGSATGPDSSVTVDVSSSRDGGQVVVTGEADADVRGHCIHGTVGGDGSYVLDAKECFADAQCRDGARATWDRCLHSADALGVCGHRFGGGDTARFEARACASAAACDDGDALTQDFCARADRLVPAL